MFATVDLPEPDSPTMASVVPRLTEKDTSSTTLNISFLRGSLSQFARRSELDETQFKTILRKLDFARVQFEKDLSDYSAGQKKKVLLARSLCQSAHLYVWDEPLNYIDVFPRMQLEELLRVCRPAMLLVEHDQAFLEGLADKRVELVPA